MGAAILSILRPTAVVRGLVPTPQDTVRVPLSIDRTATQSVNRQLSEFLSSVHSNTIVVFPAKSRYRIDGRIKITGVHDVTINGNGAEFIAVDKGDQKRRHWVLEDVHHVVLANFSIKGANPNGGIAREAWKTKYAFQHGIQLNGATGVTITNVTITDTYGDFVYLGPDAGGKWTDSVVIQKCHFLRNGRQGIALTAARNVTIRNNEISMVRQSSIDIEPNSEAGGAENVTITGNVFGPGRQKFLTITGQGSRVNNILVENNQLQGRSMTIIARTLSRFKQRTNIRIINNRSDTRYSSDSPLMSFQRLDTVVIRGNTGILDPKRKAVAIKLAGVCHETISDNAYAGAPKVVSRGTASGCGTAPPTSNTRSGN
jgi:hypothetical protein